MTADKALIPESQRRKLPGLRWWICGLLFFATTINYVDRMVISILKPDYLEKEFKWTQTDFANIMFCFQLAYAIGLLVIGRIIDWIGVRLGFSLSVVFWSIAAISTGWARTLFQFKLARFGLGLSESGNFPAAIRTVSEWFPKKERALATGIFNAGANVGALITPIIVPWIALNWGWQAAFYWTGAMGFVWLICWVWFYRSPHLHPYLRRQELEYIRSDAQDPRRKKISWINLLAHRQTWAFVVAKFMTDPIWWMYLTWVPDFLNKRHGLNLKDFGPPLVVIYLMTDVGSILGGWYSSWRIKKGWSVNKSRKTAMLNCALCVVPIMAASQVSHLWVAVFLIGLAASAHQGWSANVFTLVSDTVPQQVISSVVGIGGMAGAIGGMLFVKLVGYILDANQNNYLIPFLIASFAYLIALAIVHLLNPRLEPMKFKSENI